MARGVRLSDETKKKILEDVISGISHWDIAEKYQVSTKTVYRISKAKAKDV